MPPARALRRRDVRPAHGVLSRRIQARRGSCPTYRARPAGSLSAAMARHALRAPARLLAAETYPRRPASCRSCCWPPRSSPSFAPVASPDAGARCAAWPRSTGAADCGTRGVCRARPPWPHRRLRRHAAALDDERRVLLVHERAHLRLRHHRYLRVADLHELSRARHWCRRTTLRRPWPSVGSAFPPVSTHCSQSRRHGCRRPSHRRRWLALPCSQSGDRPSRCTTCSRRYPRSARWREPRRTAWSACARGLRRFTGQREGRPR